MKFEPVWVSTVNHLGKHAKLGIEAKRHALKWVDNSPQTKVAGITVFFTSGLKYPSKDLERFPHCVNGSFPPAPLVLFASGRLELDDQQIDFASKPLRLKQGEFRKMLNIRFNLSAAHMMTVMRFKSPFTFDRRFNINWIRIVTTEDTVVMPSSLSGRVGKAIKGVTGNREVMPLLGRDFLMCVGSGEGDMSAVHHRTDDLYDQLVVMKRQYVSDLGAAGEDEQTQHEEH